MEISNPEIMDYGDLSVKGFLEAKKAEQVVCKELPPRPIQQGQLLRIEIVVISLSLDFN